ncbi:MAG: NAD(P)-dependent glycerol-3-phosphate dehydrogenase [Ignavibacteria bacterium]|nr:NAD(P)-dependent glycerol-3-phosphate dehydrogenase [Ignavibacteria bacterium]
MNIGVLGAGSWGTTLAILLAHNAHSVSLWTHKEEYLQMMLRNRENPSFLPGIPLPSSIQLTDNILEATSTKEMLVLAVPAQYLRSVLENLNCNNFPNAILVNVAKGIETTTLKTMSQMIAEVFPQQNSDYIVTLSGPSHAEEVCQNIPTAVVASSRSMETIAIVQRAFSTNSFRVYLSTDILGVELGGSLKNIIAIGAGIVDGAGFGDNTKAALMSGGLIELTQLGVAMGAKEKTFYGLAGVGDLFVTCTSKHSRNRYVGEQLGKGRKWEFILREMEMVAEGVATTKSAVALAKQYNVETPIINEVHKIIFEGKDAHEAAKDLMSGIAVEEC